MPSRESQFRVQDHDVLAPSGAHILASGTAMDDLIHRLHHGDPTVGWEGDTRLAVAYNKMTDRWELWRREHDDRYRLIGQSPVGLSFPTDLVKHLVSIDGRRGYNAVKHVQEHNEAIEKAVNEKFQGQVRESAGRLKWALQRDLGDPKTHFAI
jgi:hypothetical protein